MLNNEIILNKTFDKKLKPTSLKYDFINKIMKRYDLSFIISKYQIIESLEYGIEWRDATNQELEMWNRLIPKEIKDKLDKLHYLENDCILSPTSLEILDTINTLAYSQKSYYFYICVEDFTIIYNQILKDNNFHLIYSRDKLLLGRIVDYIKSGLNKIFICLSRFIPSGYYFISEEIDPILSWRPKSDVRELRPIPNDWDYELKPIYGLPLSET